MKIFCFFQRKIHRSFCFSISLLFVVSCGGGGSNTSRDTTPDAFFFDDLTGVELNEVILSNSITVSGIDAPAPISIVNGEYSINDGDFTAEPGTIELNQQVIVRVRSSTLFQTSTLATLTIGGISDNFDVTTMGATVPPSVTRFDLSPTMVKRFEFTWEDVPGATFYRLQQNDDGISGFETIIDNIPPGTQQTHLEVALFSIFNAQYLLEACNNVGCSSSNILNVDETTLTSSIGYFKASNPGLDDVFAGSRLGGGNVISLSDDGSTLAVGSWAEDNFGQNSGAVYIFIQNENGVWIQQDYLKASNSERGDSFGSSVSLSKDGNILAVGASQEDSNSEGVNGSQENNDLRDSGAAYIFTRDQQGMWSQQAYLKASNPGFVDEFGISVSLSEDGRALAVGAIRNDGNGSVYVFTQNEQGVWAQQHSPLKASNSEGEDFFGVSVSLSGDGNTLAVGANQEDSNSTGVNGPQDSNAAVNSGAVYVFTQEQGVWAQQSYLKASNTETGDEFGLHISLSGDGNSLAVGAMGEDSNSTGINDNGNQENNAAVNSGAVYVFTQEQGVWAQQGYLKASNTDEGDYFGRVSLSDDGNTLAVGADRESSNAKGINGNQDNNAEEVSGAVYVFTQEQGMWTQQSYLKGSNTESADGFGDSVKLSGDGNTLAVGASGEDSISRGINGDQNNNDLRSSGALYLY